MNSKFALSVLTVFAAFSMSPSAFAGGGPHEHQTCFPGNVVTSPLHTVFEQYLQIDLGNNNKGNFLTISTYGRFDDRQTSNHGPGCRDVIVKPGTASLHLLLNEFSPNYEVITKDDYTNIPGITVTAIREQTGRIVGVKYANAHYQEVLEVICHVDYSSGQRSHNNVPGTANGVINGITFNNQEVNCRSIAWTNTLPR